MAADESDEASPILDTRGPDPRSKIAEHDIAVDVAVDGREAVVWLSGEIDVAIAPMLKGQAGSALSKAQVVTLVVDLSQVTFVDSTIIGALVDLRQRAIALDKRMSLRGVPPPVSRMLELTGLSELFGVSNFDQGRC